MERLTIRYNGEKIPFCPPCIKCATRCDECEHLDKMMYKLADYEDAEEQGLLLRLPCKIGDELWWFDAYGDLRTSEVNSMFVEFGIEGIVIETLICNIYANDIGKTVFLTKEEAEQALKQMGE